jgi:hypothetical protein
VDRMSGRPEINGMKACVHGCYYDVCKKNPCRGMYKEWLLQKIENESWLQTKIKDEDFEIWKERNRGRADGVDAMIYLLERFMKGGKRAEMRDDLSALIARVRGLEM